ncbi:MAG: pyruvate kinase [Marinilabiliales bacterium]|nr:pyruvate kinase [Marinilabiliales bacterium]
MKNIKHTKIVATISDKNCSTEFLSKLMEAGMNVVRINTAHQTTESAMEIIRNIRSVSDSIAILVDTKGPEIRTKNITEPIQISKGETIRIKGGVDEPSGNQLLVVDYLHFVRDIPVGSAILIDDGELELTITGREEDALLALVSNGGWIKNRKSINVPGVSLHLPSLTEKDKQFIRWAAANDLDFIAHSFVRNKEDVQAVQEILDEEGSKIKIIAKIENTDGVKNIEEILDHAYGIMVARGDLGIEIAAEKIPAIQRKLIRKCVERKKPVIIATQMLHSMISNPRPTRAEVSDVAIAIFDRTDAIMLSGETAYGQYPVEAVQIMSRVAMEVESSKDKRNDLPVPRLENEVSAFLAEAAVMSANELKVSAIITDTLTGKIARYISAFRGPRTVYAKCHNGRVKRELALSYGVIASEIVVKKNKHKLVETSLIDLVNRGCISEEDTVVYVGGNFGVGGGTSFIEIASVSQMMHQKKKKEER